MTFLAGLRALCARRRRRVDGLRWKLNRLRTMSGREICWRTQRSAQAMLERHGLGLVHQPPAPLPSWGAPWVSCWPAGMQPLPYLRSAERILAGRFDIFALHAHRLGFPPRWNRDPKTGSEAPLVFGKTLAYREAATVGNIKYLWEINRHQALVTLAQAWHLTHLERYASACRSLLESWFDECPYPRGQAWSNALENAIRLVNWSVAWHLLGAANGRIFDGEQGAAFRRRWLDSIYQHCHFITGHLSRHSSANNHLFGEYMGLFIGATTWPGWEASAGWRELAHRGLEQEAQKQNSSDGVNLEQGSWYHHEVADMMLLCGLYGHANGSPFSGAYWARLCAMLEFIDAIMDISGNVPMIGDADDAVMVRFDPRSDFNPYVSLLASGAVVFGRGQWKRHAVELDEKSRWLLGDRGSAVFASQVNLAGGQALQKTVFDQGGYYILGSDFASTREVKIVADAGALGYLSIAAHGHADALAITVSVAGHPMLIDPGTFSYHTEQDWRGYFRGTAAHNTVRVDKVDQSIQAGNFMWLSKANAFCEHWESDCQRDFFVGVHDGYRRLQDPVLHRRRICYLKKERLLIVDDEIECKQVHDLEIHWHFSDLCTVTASGRAALAVCGPATLTMTLQHAHGELQMVRGRTTPALGWISHRFDERTASPSLVWSERIHGSVKRRTVFQINIDPD